MNGSSCAEQIKHTLYCEWFGKSGFELRTNQLFTWQLQVTPLQYDAGRSILSTAFHGVIFGCIASQFGVNALRQEGKTHSETWTATPVAWALILPVVVKSILGFVCTMPVLYWASAAILLLWIGEVVLLDLHISDSLDEEYLFWVQVSLKGLTAASSCSTFTCIFLTGEGGSKQLSTGFICLLALFEDFP